MPNLTSDLARMSTLQRQGAQLRNEMEDRMQTLSKGRAADLAKHLGATSEKFLSANRRSQTLQAHISASQETLLRLSQQQTALEKIKDSSDTALQTIALSPQSTERHMAESIGAATAALADILDAMNTRVAGRYIFGGNNATNRPMPTGQSALAEIADLAAQANAPEDLSIAVEGWVDNKLSAANASPFLAHDGMRAVVQSLATVVALGGASSLSREQIVAALDEATGHLLDSTSQLSELQGLVGVEEADAQRSLTHFQSEAMGLEQQMAAALNIDQYETAVSLQDLQARMEMHYTMIRKSADLSLVNYL